MKMSDKQDNNDTISYIILLIYFILILLLEMNMDNVVDAYIKYEDYQKDFIDLTSLEGVIYEQNM